MFIPIGDVRRVHNNKTFFENKQNNRASHDVRSELFYSNHFCEGHLDFKQSLLFM
jgi:hypothetical protein